MGIHCAAVEKNGSVYLIVGRGKSGKSTLYVSLLEKGLNPMNDDLVFLFSEGDNIIVKSIPLFAKLRLSSIPYIETSKSFPTYDSSKTIEHEIYLDCEKRYGRANSLSGNVKAIIFPKINNEYNRIRSVDFEQKKKDLFREITTQQTTVLNDNLLFQDLTLNEYVEAFRSKEGEGLLDSYGLVDKERKQWRCDFKHRLEVESKLDLIKSDLTKEVLKNWRTILGCLVKMYIHHKGIIVSNIEKSIAIYNNLGYCQNSEPVIDNVQFNKIVFLSSPNDSRNTELIESIDERSSICHFKCRYHHIYLLVKLAKTSFTVLKNENWESFY